ncbi:MULTISPECIES: MFS transporter [Pseudanabaena]|uniref:Major facilitator superfamily MFS_1 n=2 Tax=Pseudanabaena TaxID=1152 RepID=L8N2Y3_9CYAN|nr:MULTISPECIES: MFS transporter [Pseudanabaena]ELS33429.1 major facilitator superfamily MFS_1 [Pseudanabaena biceps PCC 7429]MDG3494367.1 MFS transporter [Pseudanabaena catenata USMAC16]
MIVKTYAEEDRELKVSIRTSLQASSIDGSLSTVFSNITSGVLLSSFLIDLGASPFEIGMAVSLPMLANLLQPLGALLSNRSHSRHNYGLWTFLPSRLLWLVLIIGIVLKGSNANLSNELVYLTLTLVFTSNILAALGSASWMSWLAALVPAKLRGRYYSVRSIVSNVTGLLCLPIASFIIANWQGGSVTGYGLVLSGGILAGVASLTCQQFMIDINPQKYRTACQVEYQTKQEREQEYPQTNLFKNLIAPFHDRNLIFFLIYVAFWGFAVNLSAPFFNLYMLENLGVDITWVTLFSSLSSGANMLMLLVWGRLSDRFGNRPLLIFMGIAIAITPLFWLITSLAQVQAQLWLYLILFHLFLGGTWAAIDLGSNNIQIGIAPMEHHATFFAIASAIAGVSSALGTTVGGALAQYAHYEGIFGVFVLSAILRLFAIIPLLFVHENL